MSPDRKRPLNGRRRRGIGSGRNVGLTPNPVRTLLERLSDAIHDQERLLALRAVLLSVRQVLSQSVVLKKDGAIRAVDPVKMEKQPIAR